MGVVTNNVTAPVVNQHVAPGALLNVVAAATTTGIRITGWQIFLDSLQLFNEAQTSTSGPIEQNINKNFTIASNTALGNHTLHVKAFDDAGAVKDITIVIVVATPVAGVITQNVTAPLNNGAVNSDGTLHVTANATTTATSITSWEIWLDAVRLYNLSGVNPAIDTIVNMPTGTAPGNHTLLVKCWDNTGTLKQTSLTVVVPTPSGGGGGLPPGTPLGTKPVSAFTTQNVSHSPVYDQAHFPAMFTGTTNHDGVNLATNPALNDDSENAAAPMIISKESLRNLMPIGWAGRIACHAQVWWGLASHPAIGFDNRNQVDMDKIAQDLKDRGYDVWIPDWYGPTKASVCNDATVDVLAQACVDVGGLNFMVMIDEQYFSNNGYTAATYQAGIIAGINHLMDRYAAHPNYEHYNYNGVSRPLILLWDVAAVGGANINWSTVRAAVASHGNPLLIQYQAGGFTVVESDGALAWLDTNSDKAGNPPSGSSYLTSSFLPACTAHQDKICLSSVWKGFNGTITRSTSWSLGKWLNQRFGQTWLDVWKTNSDYVTGGKRLDYVCTVTLDDFQEGSAVQAGIRTDVAIAAAILGNILSFTQTGNENTVRRYNLWGTIDGITAQLLATGNPGTRQFDLTALPGLVAGGNYTLYVEAQGMPSLQNHMAPQTFQRTFVLNSVPPVAFMSADNVSGVRPLPVSFDASGSTDQNNAITNYHFDFGDGSTPQDGVNQVATHTYAAAGIYTCTLTVTDSAGLTGTATVVITVTDPIVTPPSPVTPTAVVLRGLSTTTPQGVRTVYEIPLVAAAQKLKITLNGKPYQLTIRYNNSAKAWNMDIRDDKGAAVLTGIPLVTGADLLAQYAYLQLGGQLFVQTDAGNQAIPTFADLGKSSHLFFVVTA
jgi:PKD repeat protein